MGTKDIINAIGDIVIENRDWLTELDSPIGDSDHGVNMARGFEAVRVKLGEMDEEDMSGVLKKTGMTLMTTVGGASGALYATAFLRMSKVAAEKDSIDTALAAEMLSAAITGIMERGKAEKGEKTMLDSMIPARDALQEGAAAGKFLPEALEDAYKAAEAGVEFTKTIVATKGRAAYVGERSLGHQDPGATSFTLMMKVLVQKSAEM